MINSAAPQTESTTVLVSSRLVIFIKGQNHVPTALLPRSETACEWRSHGEEDFGIQSRNQLEIRKVRGSIHGDQYTTAFLVNPVSLSRSKNDGGVDTSVEGPSLRRRIPFCKFPRKENL